MPIETDLARVKQSHDTLITIGVFDGVHVGHQYLLSSLQSKARDNGWLSAVITFKTHPESVVTRTKKQPWLIDLSSRVELIKKLGIDLVVTLPFTAEVRGLSAEYFVELLKKYLKTAGLIIGPDFAMGSGRQGNAEMLQRAGNDLGFSVDVMPPFLLDGEIVSSSAIRQMISSTGDVKKAARFLGRPFRVTSTVVEGDRRGRTLGFPTINMKPNAEFVVPSNGVYATLTNTGNAIMPSVTSIGVRPTFGGVKRLIETYIPDYSGDLYGCVISVDFVDKIRNERRFDTPNALKGQMAKDVEIALSVLRIMILQREPVL